MNSTSKTQGKYVSFLIKIESSLNIIKIRRSKQNPYLDEERSNFQSKWVEEKAAQSATSLLSAAAVNIAEGAREVSA